MEKLENKKNNLRKIYQMPLAECLIYISFGFAVFFLMKSIFSYSNSIFFNEKVSITVYSILFAFIVICLSLGFYADYKYNKAKFKNIFLYLGALIALTNFLAVILLPNVVNLPNGATQTITTNLRVYSILYGFVLGILPYLFFYAVPRKITHKRYMEFVLVVFVVIVSTFVVISLFKESKIYIDAIKNGFSDMSEPVKSIFAHKNIFARMLMIGIFSSIILHIYTNKWPWLLFIIPFFAVELFTSSKMPLVLTIAVLLFYLIIRLIPVVKKSKDNLKIFIFISCFVFIMVTIFSIMIGYSETGLLFSIKKMFLSFGDSAKTTFHYRTIIWENTFNILKPYQYIFGYGIVPVATAIHNSYSLDPRCEPDTSHIWTAHNGFIEIIAEGGIIYLLINIFLIYSIIRVSIKIYKQSKYLSIFIIGLCVVNLIHSITDPIMLFNEGDASFLTALMTFPVFSLYYSTHNKDEIEIRKSIVNNVNDIKKLECKNPILNLLKIRYLYDAKCIENDLIKNRII